MYLLADATSPTTKKICCNNRLEPSAIMLSSAKAEEELDRAIDEVAHTLENEPRETDLLQASCTGIKLKESRRQNY